MDKIKTNTIITIVVALMVGVVIYLNRDKFASKSVEPAEGAQE